MVATAAGEMQGPRVAAWLPRLDVEVENLRAAMDWGFETDPVSAIDLVVGVGQHWRHRQAWTEGAARLRQAVAAYRALPPATGDERPARLVLGARLLSTAGQAASVAGRRTPEALGWTEESLRLARASGDRRAISMSLMAVGLAQVFDGAGAEELAPVYEELLPLSEELEEWSQVAYLAANYASSLSIDEPAAADPWLERARESARRSQDPAAIAFAATTRGRIFGRRGDLGEARRSFDEAEALYRETISAWLSLGQGGVVANQLESVAYLALRRGDPSQAATLLGAAEAIRERSDAPMLPDERVEHRAEVERLRGAADRELVGRAWGEGRALSMEDATALVLVGEPAKWMATGDAP